jgi:hypothetical protein
VPRQPHHHRRRIACRRGTGRRPRARRPGRRGSVGVPPGQNPPAICRAGGRASPCSGVSPAARVHPWAGEAGPVGRRRRRSRRTRSGDARLVDRQSLDRAHRLVQPNGRCETGRLTSAVGLAAWRLIRPAPESTGRAHKPRTTILHGMDSGVSETRGARQGAPTTGSSAVPVAVGYSCSTGLASGSDTLRRPGSRAAPMPGMMHWLEAVGARHGLSPCRTFAHICESVA